MFGDLTTPEQQRVAQAYMPQMGGRSPSDVNTMMQMLLSNPDMAAQAMGMYNEAGGNNSPSGNSGGAGIASLMSNFLSQSDATPQTVTAPLPPKRTADVPKQVSNAPIPPVKPTEFSGDDRVAKAGGPGAPRGTNSPSSNPTAVAENSSETSLLFPAILAALGIRAAIPGTSPKQMPPEVAGTDIVPVDAQPKVLPPEAGGAVVPQTARNVPDRFSQAFADDITDAEYRDVPPRKALSAPKTEEETPKQVGNTKKLTGPKETDDRDNVKKADGKTINAEDASDEAGVSRTLNKGKATTVSEKLKPKVRVK